MTGGWTRRAALAAGIALAGRAALAGTVGVRTVSLDWGWAMTALGLGATPVGIAEQRLYRDWVGPPAIPAGVADVGLRNAPSLETLAGLRPDLILVNPLNTPSLSRFERIAPTLMNPIFSDARTPLANARAAARTLGDRLGCGARANALVAEADAAIAAARGRVAGWTGRPVVPLNAVDGRHITVFGPGSLYHDVLVALGLPVGDVGPTSIWGHRTIAVADIAALMPADLLVIAPLPPRAAASLEGPGLWRSLIAAGNGRQISLPAVWAYGDVASAARFATLVAGALKGSAG